MQNTYTSYNYAFHHFEFLKLLINYLFLESDITYVNPGTVPRWRAILWLYHTNTC